MLLKGENPHKILQKVWGNSFKSYVIAKRPGSQLPGVVYRLSLKARNRMDKWELVQMGWYEKKFIEVEILGTNQKIKAGTQVLGTHQDARISAKEVFEDCTKYENENRAISFKEVS